MQTHGLHLVDQEIPYFQGRKIYNGFCTEVPAIKLTLLIPPSGQYKERKGAYINYVGGETRGF